MTDEPNCICPFRDARSCLAFRSGRDLGWDDEPITLDDEECACGCHDAEDLWDDDDDAEVD